MKKLLLSTCLLLTLASPAWSHEDHGTPGEAGGPLKEIVLTETMIANLGIVTAAAGLQDVSRTADITANVDYFPEKQAIISSRAEGTIAKIFVHLGEAVRKGDKIAIVQPRLVGNPPITLTSPIDGFVIGQNVVIGQAITPDQELVRLADLSVVLVRGQAYEDIAQGEIRVGQKITLTTPALRGEVFKGVVHHIDAALQSGSRIREINCLVENPEGKLLANMQAKLSVHVGEQATALVVPQRAVLGELGNYFVYVREQDHFYRRDVTLGEKYGSLREIIAGVSPDEQVVTVGNYQLQFVTPSKEAAQIDEHEHEKEQEHEHEHEHSHQEHAQ